jgi:hypothetical protein
MAEGKKQAVVSEIFKLCKRSGTLEFDNDLVKRIAQKHSFRNPFDVTKLDNSDDLPRELKQEDYFVIHLGGGRHRFVKGISTGYHRFEPIGPTETFDWKYRQSILNELDTSESNILSVASNQRIIHDFLYGDIVASPKVYNARRTKMSITYWVGDVLIAAQNIQMEIDLTTELHGVVTVFEAKNGFPSDFAVFQLYHPFRYYVSLKVTNQLPISQITCCYVLRKQEGGTSTLRLYNYTFGDEEQIGSIRLLKKSQYQLIRR